jgi:hypothetical protein
MSGRTSEKEEKKVTVGCMASAQRPELAILTAPSPTVPTGYRADLTCLVETGLFRYLAYRIISDPGRGAKKNVWDSTRQGSDFMQVRHTLL